MRQDLAAALDAAGAKTLAQCMIARSWAGRDKLTLRLPPQRLTLQPGDFVELPLSPPSWAIDQISVDGYVVIADLTPATGSIPTVVGEPGRVAANPDVVAGPLNIALIDVPDVLGVAPQRPAILLAASTATTGWKSYPIEVGFSGQATAASTARTKSVLGNALTVLGANAADLIDEQRSVDVVLIDPDQWLTSCDDDALAAGENLAVLGNEVFQFGQATSLGAGRFRLSRLVRGRGGTEWATDRHAAGEVFCLLQQGSLQPVTLPVWSLGSTVVATGDGESSSTTFNANCVQPLSPVKLTAFEDLSGDVWLDWTRRSRAGFAWVDGIDAPLGESSEQYRVLITGPSGSIELQSNQPTLTVTASSLAPLGTGTVAVEVRQIGDFGLSQPAQITLNLA